MKIENAEIRTMDLAKLKPAKYNPRIELQPDDDTYKRIKASITKFGVVDPLVVNKRNGLYTIVGGHQRYNILKELGYKEIQCVLVDLDEVDEIELNLSLNKNTGFWDNEKLKDLFTNIDFDEAEQYITGFSNEEIENLKMDFIEDLVNEDFSDMGSKPLDKFSMTFTIDKIYEEKYLAYVKLFGKDKLIELMTAEVVKEVD